MRIDIPSFRQLPETAEIALDQEQFMTWLKDMSERMDTLEAVLVRLKEDTPHHGKWWDQRVNEAYLEFIKECPDSGSRDFDCFQAVKFAFKLGYELRNSALERKIRGLQ